MNKRTVGNLVATLLIALTAATAHAQAKWWWEKYPTANDKSLNLQGAAGGSVVTKQNPTGANGSVTGNTATQPPTVIIQQTASAAAASPQLTCVQTVTPASGYYTSYGTTISTCPNIQGYMATPVVGGGVSTSYITYYANATSVINNPILACCYVPVSGTAPGGAAYSPWSANSAFNSNGFSGSQKQEFLTPGTFSWSVPSAVYRVWVTVVGGGGGGGAGAYSPWNQTYPYGGGGGGRGGTGYRRPIDVIPGSTLSIRVGSGGTGATGSSGFAGNSGSPGGNSYVTINGYIVEAQGGFAGVGGYEANGYYPPQPPNPTTASMAGDGRNSCNSTTCSGQGGPMGYFAMGSGTGLTGTNDGGTGRGAQNGVAYGEGNYYNPTGAGKSGQGGSNAGHGGAAGFIGMPYSTGVPSAANGTTVTNQLNATSGTGGYGYGAGGGGGHGGGMSTSNFGNGGAGAPGAVWIEW